MFQSLYRGTAIATLSSGRVMDSTGCFNPSIEGQPLQHEKLRQTERAVCVSIPLSRDSHCNVSTCTSHKSSGTSSFNPSIEGQPLQQQMPKLKWKLSNHRFNPSIEGQPLQLYCSWLMSTRIWCFNPSIEGQPLQLKSWQIPMLIQQRFNPSIEGQPLQLLTRFIKDEGDLKRFQSLYRGTAIATRTLVGWRSLCLKRFQSLYRGTAIATEPLQRPWFPMVTIGCFSNLWLVFVF